MFMFNLILKFLRFSYDVQVSKWMSTFGDDHYLCHTRFEEGYNPKKIGQRNQLWGMKACLGGTRK